jgi:NAD(P)-dependent dehydrogenase (short-subunit alcohol dehydrogenase family)
MDVRDEQSVRNGVAEAAEWGGRLDIVVNNAGIGLLDTPLLETSSDAWRDVVETNLTGAFYVCKAAWPHLASSKGQILNVGSLASTQGFSGASAYCASKYGINGLTEVLKKEGAASGIRALCICPGAVDTDIWAPEWAGEQERARMMSADQVGELAAEMLAAPRNLDLGPWVVVNAANPWAG